ncbi:hypothetical protein BKP37_17735 [Anaerobacillus alkalilacustris]|uniref:Uncharacterized protein n=1 Tax=Anaerobacillus alkalilacustris TaxID=393763 RepID=A0A1S2LDP5_9BACI|nr:hypothetical protein [Anaerobacillus alkalilacustris]OIJ10618.1 hypothetical protein BKP37_17735 [Anaerobacillus alkalilacustris]
MKSIKGRQETLCIKVPKVYDWVTRQVDVPVQSFTGEQGLLDLNFDGPTPGGVNPCAELAGGGALTVECIITDDQGNPVDPLAPHSILCTEIPQIGGRQSVSFNLPDGETITLQKVKVLKKGHFVVRVSNAQGKSLTSEPKPFAVAEKFYLCAPEGTFLQCEITDFECDSNIICGNNNEFRQIDVSINMCQNVQMEATVKLEITADFCHPRPEIPFDCPPLSFPPQCPEIFPGN